MGQMAEFWGAHAAMALLAVLLLAALLVAFVWRRAARSRRRARSWFYLRPGDTPQGPVGLTALRAMVADGRLAADALAAPAGSNEWRPLRKLLTEC